MKVEKVISVDPDFTVSLKDWKTDFVSSDPRCPVSKFQISSETVSPPSQDPVWKKYITFDSENMELKV